MRADIVYVGNDLPGGSAPRINQVYKLVVATSTNTRTIVEGVQLRMDNSPAGWIREHHKGPIMDALKAGLECYCVVTSREQFIWGREVCFWGVTRWWIDLTDEVDGENGGG